MSFATWKEEFCPAAAHKAMGSELKAVRHAIRKWSGALNQSLKRHKMVRMKRHIIEEINGDRGFGFDANTCALCLRHGTCDGCVLMEIRGMNECFKPTAREKISPYNAFASDGDPKPMLKLLRRAEKHLVQIAGTK